MVPISQIILDTKRLGFLQASFFLSFFHNPPHNLCQNEPQYKATYGYIDPSIGILCHRKRDIHSKETGDNG